MPDPETMYDYDSADEVSYDGNSSTMKLYDKIVMHNRALEMQNRTKLHDMYLAYIASREDDDDAET